MVHLAAITASVDRCHFEIDSRIIGLDLLKELMLIEDAPPNAHYNMALSFRVAADAVQGAYDEDPQEWCASTWRNYGPDGVTKKRMAHAKERAMTETESSSRLHDTLRGSLCLFLVSEAS